MNLILSQIKKNELNNNFVLFCPLCSIPAYIGTKKECLQAQQIFETKLQNEFLKLPKNEKQRLIKTAVSLYSYKKESFAELL